jgi:hypothetical protein
MTALDWTAAIAGCCTHLAGIGNLPSSAAKHPALAAIAVLSLAADASIDHALTPDSTIPNLTIAQYTGRHDLVDDLLAHLTNDAASPARGSASRYFHVTNWLAEHSFSELILRSVQHTADDTGRAALLAHAACKGNDLMKQQDCLRDLHIRALLERDVPELGAHCAWRIFETETLAWMLAHAHDDHKSRAVRVQRRFQALRLYASLAHRLREPAITAVIDDGRELVPALTERLGLTRCELRALREATPPSVYNFNRWHSFEYAAHHLQAHAMPPHQWPGGGQPGQHAAWAASPWLTTNEFTLVPADYYGADRTTVRDAVQAFADDLLAPMLADLGQTGRSHSRILDTLMPGNLPATRDYLACIRRALIGPRGPKAFQEAAQL